VLVSCLTTLHAADCLWHRLSCVLDCLTPGYTHLTLIFHSLRSRSSLTCIVTVLVTFSRPITCGPATRARFKRQPARQGAHPSVKQLHRHSHASPHPTHQSEITQTNLPPRFQDTQPPPSPLSNRPVPISVSISHIFALKRPRCRRTNHRPSLRPPDSARGR